MLEQLCFYDYEDDEVARLVISTIGFRHGGHFIEHSLTWFQTLEDPLITYIPPSETTIVVDPEA